MFLSDKVGLSGKPTLSADKVGFSLINQVYIRKPILSVHADKVRLSAHEDKDCFPDKPTLAARTDNMGSLR